MASELEADIWGGDQGEEGVEEDPLLAELAGMSTEEIVTRTRYIANEAGFMRREVPLPHSLTHSLNLHSTSTQYPLTTPSRAYPLAHSHTHSLTHLLTQVDRIKHDARVQAARVKDNREKVREPLPHSLTHSFVIA